MIEKFYIMFDDLNEEAQRAFLEFQGIDSASEGNYEFFPLAIFEREDEDE